MARLLALGPIALGIAVAASLAGCLWATGAAGPGATGLAWPTVAGDRLAGQAGGRIDHTAGIVANNGAGLVGNNSGGLIGNNSAGFAGAVRGPIALVAGGTALLDPRKGTFTDPGAGAFFTDPGAGAFFTDPGAGAFFTDPGAGAFFREPGAGAGTFLSIPAGLPGRRLQALVQEALGGALVYLAAPDETLYRRNGRVIGTVSGSQGEYDLASAGLAENLPVVVNALFAGNRRLVGFTVSRRGANRVDLDVGSTYALELLRTEARRDGKTFSAFDLSRLPDLVERARRAIADGLLGVDLDRLVVGRQRALVGDYAAALADRRADLQAWNAILGRQLAPLVTLAGIYRYGLNGAGSEPARLAPLFGPSAIARAGSSVFVATRYSHQIVEIDASGSLRVVTARTVTDPTVEEPPPIPRNGDLVAGVRIPSPIGLAADNDGNLFVTMFSAIGAERNVLLMLCREPSPKFGLQGLEVGRVYRIAGTPEPRSDLAGFDGPSGLAVDDRGNVFVADLKNDRIVRVDRQTGSLRTVAGRGRVPFPGLSDTETAATRADLLAPSAIAWRRTAQGEEIFVLDAFHQRIRRVTAPGGDWDAATLETIAGTGEAATSAGMPIVPGGFGGDGGPARLARFHFAEVDVFDWQGSEIPLASGLALDATRGERGTLYVSDTGNARVRAMDLASGLISTLAGGGQNARDGLARDCRLATPAGLAVARDGDVLIADPGAHAVRRVAMP